jgi:hypothetical protein
MSRAAWWPHNKQVWSDMYSEQELLDTARQTLIDNDRGGYTIPTAGLYPFQWNWDAGVTALGWMTFDQQRAWDEFHALLRGQWQSGPQEGLIPHIVFHQAASSYFPGPDQWGCEADSVVRQVATTSITQPPLHASMIAAMLTMKADAAITKNNLLPIVQGLVRHHRWWYRCRDPLDTGLVFSSHPWESGMDNSPAWDEPLKAVPRTTRAYTRKDLGHVDSSMRPTQEFYDRVVYLMDFNREVGFDPDRIAKESPYRVNDIGIISILNCASHQLALLCERLGLQQDATFLRARCAMTARAIGQLWSERLGQYVSRDQITGRLLEAPTHAGFLTWHGRLVEPERDALQRATLQDWMQETPYLLPSTRRSHPGFEPARYWRGPIWQHLSALISEGLESAGHRDLNSRLQDSMQSLFSHSGFHEYYHPLTGAGLGGTRFSWTAATYLYGRYGKDLVAHELAEA